MKTDVNDVVKTPNIFLSFSLIPKTGFIKFKRISFTTDPGHGFENVKLILR